MIFHLKCKIQRKTFHISFNSLKEDLRRYSIKLRKIAVKHYLLPADQINLSLNRFYCDMMFHETLVATGIKQ